MRALVGVCHPGAEGFIGIPPVRLKVLTLGVGVLVREDEGEDEDEEAAVGGARAAPAAPSAARTALLGLMLTAMRSCSASI